jgi:hypothetical protein
MKRLLFCTLFSWGFTVMAQNEFAAVAFYNDFKAITLDAKSGFAATKGKDRQAIYPELAKEYEVTVMLPLADSGKIVMTNKGKCYAIYYFEPEKVRIKADQQGTKLIDAIYLAHQIPLYARTETTLHDNVPLTNTWIFDSENENTYSRAKYQLSIYKQEGRFYLSLQVNGQCDLQVGQ